MCVLSVTSAQADEPEEYSLIGKWTGVDKIAAVEFLDDGVAFGGYSHNGPRKRGNYIFVDENVITIEFHFGIFCRCNTSTFRFEGADTLILTNVKSGRVTHFRRVIPEPEKGILVATEAGHSHSDEQ